MSKTPHVTEIGSLWDRVSPWWNRAATWARSLFTRPTTTYRRKVRDVTADLLALEPGSAPLEMIIRERAIEHEKAIERALLTGVSENDLSPTDGMFLKEQEKDSTYRRISL